MNMLIITSLGVGLAIGLTYGVIFTVVYFDHKEFNEREVL